MPPNAAKSGSQQFLSCENFEQFLQKQHTMKRSMLSYRLVLLIAVIFVAKVKSDTYTECNDVLRPVYVAGGTNCSHWIYCNGEESFEGYCGDAGPFNIIDQTCDAPTEGCRAANATDTTTVPTAATTVSTSNTASTANTNATTAAPITNVTINDTSSISTLNSTPSLPFTSDIAGPTTLAPNTSSTAVTPNTSTDFIIAAECPAVDNPHKMVILPHPKSCSDYYVCYHGTAIPMHCSAMLHFDVRTGKCDYPQNVRCQADLSTPKEQCQSHTEDLYPHPSNCNYFYYCKKGYLMLQQCPFFFGWDIDSRSCVALNEATCFNNQKRV